MPAAMARWTGARSRGPRLYDSDNSCASATKLFTDLGSTVLRLAGADSGVSRPVELSAFSTVWLHFDYRLEAFSSSTDMLSVAVSTDGGTNWTEVAQLTGPADDAVYRRADIDISAYAGADSVIRFEAVNTGATELAHIDNVQIDDSPPAVTKPLLLVVADAGTLSSAEAERKALIESWGYTVSVIDDSDSQANFDAAVAASDVAYVSSTVSEAALGMKLKTAPIGLVNEQGALVDEFGFGLQNVNYKSLIEIDVLDNTHYITTPFPTGLLTVLTGNQMLHMMTANKAPGFDALAQVFNTGSLWDDSLGVIDIGGDLYGGGTAAGRRVLLPWGDATFDVTSLNADGRTLMQRAIEWAEGAATSTPQSLLLVVVDPGSLTAQDSDKKTLIESWGHTVTLIDDDAVQSEFDSAILANDVAYVSASVSDTTLGSKLVNAGIGVVNEKANLVDEFGFSTTRSGANLTQIDITDNSHSITTGFAIGPLTIHSSPQPSYMLSGSLAAGLGVLANGEGSSAPGLAVLETGASLSSGDTAAGRRVKLPWGGAAFDLSFMNADGQTIMQRAIEWGAGLGAGGGGGPPPPPPVCAATFSDDFETDDYTGSTGTAAWAGDWTEIVDAGNPNNGDVQVVSVSANQVLQIANRGEGAQRVADLSTYATATLTLGYWRSGLDSIDEFGTVEVSADGSSWTLLDQYVGPGSDATSSPPTVLSYDISGYMSATTHIRFLTGASNGKFDKVLYDDISICANN